MSEHARILGLTLFAIVAIGAAAVRADDQQQDGLSQAIDPTQPLGSSANGANAPAHPTPAPAPAPKPSASPTRTINAPLGEETKETFGRVRLHDPRGALDRKVVSPRSASYVGIRAVVTLPTVENFGRGKFDAIPDIYLGGNGTDELDIGLQYGPKRDARGQVIPGAFGFRAYARNSGIPGPEHWWNNSPTSATVNRPKDWVENSKQYFDEGEQVTMTVRVTAAHTVRFTVVGDHGHSLDETFTCIKGFGPGIPTEWKRVHAIDEGHHEGKPVDRTPVKLVNGHWDDVRILESNGRSVPMTGSSFSVAPNEDFYKTGSFDAKDYAALFEPARGWDATTTGGEAIEIDSSKLPASFFTAK